METEKISEGRKPGRPELPEAERRRPHGVPFSTDELALIRAAATAQGVPMTVFIRQSTLKEARKNR